MKYNLSEISEVIKNRRTIYPKHYSSRKVHKEIIEHLIENAIWAPTHGMTQPWRFKIYMEDSRKKLGEELGRIYKSVTPKEQYDEEKLNKLQDRALKASAIIIICMKKSKGSRIPFIEEIEAVACAIQNMNLTATAYGLGSFWSTPKYMYTDNMKTFLNLNKEDECLGIFYIGYPSIEWPLGQRKPIEYISEWNH